MGNSVSSWQPTYSVESAKKRARLMMQIRAYFLQANVLEVETPVLSHFAATDSQISQWQTKAGMTLHTSPEFCMKRLLAADFGDVYQICRVFRQDEVGQRHNPEFTMLEWYRLGYDEHQLMDDVVQLIAFVFEGRLPRQTKITYKEAFLQADLPDPFDASTEQLRQVTAKKLNASCTNWARDECLDALMSMVVEPSLPKDCLCFVHQYPESQAALAKTIEVEGVVVAKRFELYWQGMELANGYHELTDVVEQKRRFDQETAKIPASLKPNIDEHFLQALEAGLPECAGVALGVDRLMMILMAKQSIEDVIAFPFDRA